MDIISLIGGFGGGLLTRAIVLYLYTKSYISNGKVDCGKLEAEILAKLGNVSIDEAEAIFKRAQELGVDGYSMKDAEELGVMAIKAMKP